MVPTSPLDLFVHNWLMLQAIHWVALEPETFCNSVASHMNSCCMPAALILRLRSVLLSRGKKNLCQVPDARVSIVRSHEYRRGALSVARHQIFFRVLAIGNK